MPHDRGDKARIAKGSKKNKELNSGRLADKSVPSPRAKDVAKELFKEMKRKSVGSQPKVKVGQAEDIRPYKAPPRVVIGGALDVEPAPLTNMDHLVRQQRAAQPDIQQLLARDVAGKQQLSENTAEFTNKLLKEHELSKLLGSVGDKDYMTPRHNKRLRTSEQAMRNPKLTMPKEKPQVGTGPNVIVSGDNRDNFLLGDVNRTAVLEDASPHLRNIQQFQESAEASSSPAVRALMKDLANKERQKAMDKIHQYDTREEMIRKMSIGELPERF